MTTPTAPRLRERYSTFSEATYLLWHAMNAPPLRADSGTDPS